MADFDGLVVDLGSLHRLSAARSRSISPENFTGEPGGGGMATEGTGAHSARDLGRGWKISPSVPIQPGETFTLADIEGPGAIQHVWMTLTPRWRSCILRIYWDDQEQPSVECPAGDFFAQSGQRLQLLLADALPASLPHHARESWSEAQAPLLPDRLRAR
jgi:hypothetical protein